MQTPKCEERIEEHLKGREEQIKVVLNSNDPSEELDSLILGVSKTQKYKVELSTGGPSDWIEYEYDSEEKQLVDIVYHFADWFDHAERSLDEKSEQYKILERLFNEYICPDF